MIDERIVNAACKADTEKAIKSIFDERGFEFTEEEWNELNKKEFDKMDIAKLCWNHVVFSSVDCLDRYILVAYDNGPDESAVKNVLEERYDQWNDVENYPEVETYCCEEWMLEGMVEFGDFRYYVIYGDNDE